MKWMKRTAALGAAALLTLSLAACSGGNADETVAAALEKVKGASSVDAVIEIAAEYTSEDQNLSVTNRMNLTTFQDPLKIKADVVLDMVSGEDTYNQTITMYAQKEGEELVQYATDGSYWAFYQGDAYAELGVDQTPIHDGDSFKLVYTAANS